MTTTAETYRVEHESREDFAGNDWHVMDADGECFGSHPTRAAAHKEAKKLNREAEVSRLAEAIGDRVSEAEYDGDVETLRKVAALLGL